MSVVPATLSRQSQSAAARAATYLRGRQSGNGGFCFYKADYVDEPNLHGTSHATAASTLLGEAVPRSDELMRFLDRYPLYGLNYLYYCISTTARSRSTCSARGGWHRFTTCPFRHRRQETAQLPMPGWKGR